MSLLLPNQEQQILATTQSDEDIIIECLCRERRGTVVRRVRKMLFTPDNLKKFWEKSRQYPILFHEEIVGDFKKFLELFLYQVGKEVSANGLFWIIDDFVGVYYLNHIVPNVDAQVHYSFFDGAQNGREELTKEMLKYVFLKYNFHRLSCSVPCYASPSTANFVERLGFKFEGKKRKAALYNNDWFDVRLYGLLKENHLNGNAN